MRTYVSPVFESIYALFMELCEIENIKFHKICKSCGNLASPFQDTRTLIKSWKEFS